ncbi:MAG TPA: CRTAC1 family protein [Candidatus Polarisedimenticolia bacterium]|nr:CRTAC1 family protein [Candidatus Polarisedimenticolia bacterium]
MRRSGSPSEHPLLSVSVAIVLVASALTGYVTRGAPPEGGPAAGKATGTAAASPAAGQPSAGTRKMAERLQRIVAETDPGRNPFMNAARVKLLEQMIQNRGGDAPPQMKMELATQLLNSGRNDDAIAMLDRLEEMLRPSAGAPPSRLWFELRIRQAVAQLRRAETDNCIERHNPRSCLFPVHGSGIHAEKRGSRAAVTILESVLAVNPDHRQARWLLNIAYMILGEYPQGVPARWLLPPKLFESDYDIGRFPDIAARPGLDVDDLAGGTIADDFDGDGYLDLFVSSAGLQTQIRYFRSNADGTFTDKTADAGLTGLVGGLNIMQTDYDNDGRLDVLVLRGGWMGAAGRYPKSLLHNDGGGRFSDVTEEAGLLSYHPSQTAVWRDFDGDGWLDLFVGNETSEGSQNPCELFRNNGDGTFTECAAEAGVTVNEYVKGVAGGDFDNDGRPDLYVSVRGRPNHLFRNVGAYAEPPAAGALRRSPAARGSWAGRFTDVAVKAGVTEPSVSFPTWFFDYDNDGWEDIMVTGYGMQDVGDIAADYMGRATTAQKARLYHNNGDGTFTNVSRALGVSRVMHAMGANFGDLDNDGWLDFYVGTGDPDFATLIPSRMFRNDGGKRFQEVTTSGGFGMLQKGHGIAFGDLDNDGDQDVFSKVGGAVETDNFTSQLFLNPGHGNHWLKVQLEGVKTNRLAIGARVRVVVREGGTERSIYRTVNSGASFGASPLRAEVGLGQATEVLRVEVFWPVTGVTQVVTGLEPDHAYFLREGQAAAVPVRLKTFTIPTEPVAGHHHHHP